MSEIIEAPKTMREKVDSLAESMLALPQADCPVRHYFAPGVFAREITVPEGICIVGAVHKTENLVVISSGKLRLATEDGAVDITAPHIMTCKAGAKNAFVALETVVWTNFFHNPEDETDIDKLIEKFSYSKASDLLGGSNNLQLSANKAAELEEK